MSFTRAQYRTRTIRIADAAGSTRWDDTAGATGEIDQLLGKWHDYCWRRILNSNPYYRMSKRQPTSDSSGFYALSDLSSGTADSVERFYRVVDIIINNRRYPFEQRVQDHLLAETVDGSTGYYAYRRGDYLVALPLTPSQVADVWVNHLPTRIDNLSADSVNVTFVDGCEEIISTFAAADMLRKGGAEASAAEYLRATAEADLDTMLQDVARTSIEPLRIQYPDSAQDWSG